ncbi:MAG: ComF family protein [Anaerolineae bacterium]|nr:ComF family protein [Anaerolineae bacterium]
MHIKFSIKSIKSLGVYNQSLRKAIHSLKFNRNLALGDEFSAELAELVLSTTWPVDLIVPVPASRKRRSERGYNQAEIIAFPLALLLKLPFSTKSLVKVGETRSQIGLSLAERINNIQNAFSADPKYVNKKNVLLVDDVSTTGATLNACAQALISAGAQSVYGVTIAKAILNTEHSDDLTQISF